jgi:hypothetical protein
MWLAHMGMRRGAYAVLVGHMKGRVYWQILGVDWRIRSKWIIKVYIMGGRGQEYFD